MRRTANFRIVEENEQAIVIEDIGPWDQFQTVTNAAEATVRALASRLQGRRLEYYDSEGEWGELLVKNGEFSGFGG